MTINSLMECLTWYKKNPKGEIVEASGRAEVLIKVGDEYKSIDHLELAHRTDFGLPEVEAQVGSKVLANHIIVISSDPIIKEEEYNI